MQNNPNINAERIKGHLELDAGTTASAPLHLNTGSDVTSPTEGDVMFNGSRLKICTSSTTETIAFLSDISVSGVTSVTGTTNRITSTGGSTPQIDIAATYVGQSSITTLGTITTGTWNATAISDTYISSASTWNAKLSSVTGTTNRITVTGGSTIDISTSYVGQSSITTLGTISTGTWQGTTISTTYTEAKIKGSISQHQIAYGTSTANTIKGDDSFKFEELLMQVTMLGGIRLGLTTTTGPTFLLAEANYTLICLDACDVSLPQATSAVLGKIYNVKNLGGPGKNVRVIPDGTDTIDGNNTPITINNIESYTLVCSGTAWYIV